MDNHIVVSLGRTGSELLGKSLFEHKNITSYSEVFFESESVRHALAGRVY